MQSLIFNFGYLGLFVVSYLSATVVPLSAEVAVVGMVALGYNAVLIVLIATTGSMLGAVTNYYVGLKGSDFIFSRYYKIEPEALDKAEERFNRWGGLALFFSWLPFVGDMLTVIAGVLRTDMKIFLFWVLLGRIFREALTVALAAHVINLPWKDLCLLGTCR
ncbi:MAG: YqaA family protein [Chloroflexota bacterium]